MYLIFMKRFVFLSLFMLCVNVSGSSITPSEVYTEVKKIEKEIDLIHDALKIKRSYNKKLEARVFKTNIKPRHVWQKTYLVMVKINILRKNHNMPRVEEVSVEAVKNLEPDLVYEMTQRVLTELHIFKKLRGIKTQISKTALNKNKKPLDVFNLMHRVSQKLDIINESQVEPSDVYAQVMRLHDDITIILKYLSLVDNTTPPLKNVNSKPQDALNSVFAFIDIIHEIHKKTAVDITDFDTFKVKKAIPSDVINVVTLALAELQTIKAFLGIGVHITPPANRYQGKNPSDVEQVMRWNVDRINILFRSRFFE